VASPESVVLALGAFEKAGQTIFLTQGLEPVAAARQQLVRISLVANIPDDLVARSIKYRVESHRKLDNSQARANVPAGARADLDETRPHLLRDGAQLVARHRLQVGWRMDTIEN